MPQLEPVKGVEQEPRVDDDIKSQAVHDTVLRIVEGYRQEARDNRKSGPAARDEIWDSNVKLYWSDFDFSHKAEWQAKEILPEAPLFVDRFAASMKNALMSNTMWYTPIAPGQDFTDLEPLVRKFMDFWLARVAVNHTSQPLSFGGVFEEAMKLGAIMAACTAVTWKEGNQGGYVSVDVQDPRSVWLDPRMRGLYRVRRIEVDKHDLVKLAKMQDRSGEPLYDLAKIKELTEFVHDEEVQKGRSLGGTDPKPSSSRVSITLDEYLCTLVDDQGEVLGENALVIVANEKFIIRGPEPNPFWHKKDWVVYAPLILVPRSPYGRSYMENWAGVARTFVELTNLILDATFTTAMKAFAMVPEMLQDPTEADEGVHPNKTFLLEDGSDPRMFLHSIDLGRLGSEPIQVWQGLKQEMREGAMFSEIALGQLPPKGDITATEINASEQGSSQLIRAIASTVEERWLEPNLNLIWATALQHFDESDKALRMHMGEDGMRMLSALRKEFVEFGVTFKVRGLSSVIDRSMKLKALLSAMQVFAQNEQLMQIFFKAVPPELFVRKVLELLGLDLADFKFTPREQAIQQLEAQGEAEQADPGAAAAAAATQAQGAAQTAGTEQGTQDAAAGAQQDRQLKSALGQTQVATAQAGLKAAEANATKAETTAMGAAEKLIRDRSKGDGKASQ